MTENSLEQNLDRSLALLARTPAVLDALLRDLPEAWTLRNEGESTWSAFEVLGHLIHCERVDWLTRARIILQSGEAQPFPPFDRQGHVHEIEGMSLPQLLEEFAVLRAENLAALRDLHLSEQDLQRRGRHPALGVVILAELLSAWAVHDLTHLHQISRVMAWQYRDAVGPWSRFLGVLQCSGHSAAS